MSKEKKEPEKEPKAKEKEPMSLDEYKGQFGVVKESDLPEAERKPKPKAKKAKPKGPPKMRKYEGKPMSISLKGLLAGIKVKKA